MEFIKTFNKVIRVKSKAGEEADLQEGVGEREAGKVKYTHCLKTCSYDKQ